MGSGTAIELDMSLFTRLIMDLYVEQCPLSIVPFEDGNLGKGNDSAGEMGF